MGAKTPLRDLPDMDDIRIGPGGETFGQLKANVRATREIYTTCPCEHHVGALEAATRMLKAAYVRVGLPYKAP